MHQVEIKRRMGEADIAAISALLGAASAANGHRALGEHQWLDLVQGGREGFAGLVAREAGRERVIAYAQISRGNDNDWALEYVVHPRWRARAGGELEIELLAKALGVIAAQGGGHVHLWVPKPGPADDAVAEATGMRRGRDLVQMRRQLPVVGEAVSIEVRPFRPGTDERAWLEVNNRAFHDHPEQGSWDLETLSERERQPWFDPSGFLLHEEGGRLAGFCWTKVHEPEDAAGEGLEQQLGEIYVIAVDPDFQGHALGRQLVLAGLASLYARGVGVAMLYVDHDNTPARKLYFSLGFTDDHTDRAYVIDVPPTGDTP